MSVATGLVSAAALLIKLLFILVMSVFSFSEYTALYTYESPEPSDLSFREGDLILVGKKDGEWWHGSIGDSKGVFPSNYVKPKEADVRTLTSHYVAKYCKALLLFPLPPAWFCVVFAVSFFVLLLNVCCAYKIVLSFFLDIKYIWKEEAR